MKIKFIKEYRVVDPNIFPQRAYSAGGTMDFISDESAQWLIDNGFAEEVKESNPLFEELTHDDQGGRVAVDIWFRKNRNGGHSKKMIDFIQFMEAINVVSQDEGFMRKSGGGFGWPVIEYTTNNPGVEDIAGRQHAGEFYFDTREHALASANNHTGAWQTILNYDWGKGDDDED